MTEKLRNMTSLFLSRGGRLLMLYRKGGRVVHDKWIASAGGHFEPEELGDPEACVLRELGEELGIRPEEVEGLTLRYITVRRTNGEIRQNYYFFAELKAEVTRPLVSDEGDLRWVDYAELPSLDMPFTAQYVMEHYLREGMHTDSLYGGVATEETVVFTALAK